MLYGLPGPAVRRGALLGVACVCSRVEVRVQGKDKG